MIQNHFILQVLFLERDVKKTYENKEKVLQLQFNYLQRHSWYWFENNNSFVVVTVVLFF